MEQNQDLFADDHASLGQLVDRLDQIPASELTAKWPKALSELVDVLACERRCFPNQPASHGFPSPG